MKDPRIQDNPSLKKLLTDIRLLELIRMIFPVLKPFLRLLGIPSDQLKAMQATLLEVKVYARQARALVALPDRFNNLFAPRGWIMYEGLNVDVAQRAIAKATAGDVEGAELDLIEYYDRETIDRLITTMIPVNAFRPRIPLAYKALVDYTEGRYHACVPVVLALLDGMANDLTQHGFFAQAVTLDAWDSVAGHSTGLARLAKLFTATRQTTTTEPISLPYRNGILHGIDLGYDNKMVAAKSWAALFAAREWAVKVQRGQVTAPREQPKPALRDSIRQIRETTATQARLATWVARDITPGIDIPPSGEPEAFAGGTPEQKLAEFLKSWQRRNYGYMAECAAFLFKDVTHPHKLAGQLKDHHKLMHLKTFEILDISDDAPTITVIKAKLVYETNGNEVEQVKDFRLISEDPEGHPVPPDAPGSKWVLYTPYV